MTVVDALAYAPPIDQEFIGKDFLESEGLRTLAERVIEKHDDTLGFIHSYELKVLWKRKGGQKAGKGTLGKCGHPTGLTGYFSGADWIIWLAADHVRTKQLNARQVEALLFHELNHCVVEEEKGPTVVGHDLEIFLAEVEEYGLWREDLVAAAPVFRQLELGGPFTDGDGG